LAEHNEGSNADMKVIVINNSSVGLEGKHFKILYSAEARQLAEKLKQI
jgi:hypothetical protein